jgi:hypothetical protein
LRLGDRRYLDLYFYIYIYIYIKKENKKKKYGAFAHLCIPAEGVYNKKNKGGVEEERDIL